MQMKLLSMHLKFRVHHLYSYKEKVTLKFFFKYYCKHLISYELKSMAVTVKT